MDRIRDHVVLSHPIFDYIEATAQVPELRAFVQAEIAEQHHLPRRDECAAGFVSTATSAAAGEARSASDALRALDGMLGSRRDNRYFDLLNHAAACLSMTEAVRGESIISDVGIATPPFVEKPTDSLKLSEIYYGLRLIHSRITSKVHRGFIRLGFAPSNCDKRVSDYVIDDSVELCLVELLRKQPLAPLDSVKDISDFLDSKANYYDRLFDTILWSM